MKKEPFFDHEKLVAYQKSIQFVAWSTDLLETISAKYSVCDQLERAATSVPLNIAEGNGKHTTPTAAASLALREVQRWNARPVWMCWSQKASATTIRFRKERLYSTKSYPSLSG